MIVKLKGYDIINPNEVIEKSSALATYKAKIKGISTTLEIREIDCFWIAIAREFPDKILGYYDNRFTGYSFSNSPVNFLHDVSQDFINPGLVVVDQEFIGNRIGTILNEQREKRADSLEKILLIMPGRPGDELPQDERDRRFPYSTEQLKAYYLRHGFREFSEDEAKNCMTWLNLYKNRISRMLDNAIGYPNPPPIPDPIFGESLKEDLLKYILKVPIIRDIPLFNRAFYRRRPIEQWRKKYDRIILHADMNYEYVMSHVVYNNVGIDITKIGLFTWHSKK